MWMTFLQRALASDDATLNRLALKRSTVSHALLLCAAVVIAAEPLIWLVNSWQGHDGWIAALLVVALGVWSVTSPIPKREFSTGLSLQTASRDPLSAFKLLLVTGALRVLAQIADINILGAVLLCVDVYAIARLMHMDVRQRALSPVWLAVLFAFCLPIEPVLQRVFGFLLQQVSAWLACGMLTPLFGAFGGDLACTGTRLTLDGVDVLVDLPCSGAELVSTCGLVLALINTVKRPNLVSSLVSVAVGLAVALVGNAVRIGLLALGIRFETVLGFSVMEPVPHNLIGLLVVGLVTITLLFFAQRYRRTSMVIRTSPKRTTCSPMTAGSILCLAVGVGALQPQPVDASPQLAPLDAPLVVAGFSGAEQKLTAQEANYFATYGGVASRTSYGPFALLLVSTLSPLRHLHDPTVCITGNGYDVELVGTDHTSGTTVYRVSNAEVAQDKYTVHVSYVSAHGELATSVSEVVWRWLGTPGTRWTMVQRILPDGVMETEAYDASVRRAFNIYSTQVDQTEV